MKNLQEQELLQEERSVFNASLHRRSFLQFAGASVAAQPYWQQDVKKTIIP